MANSAPFEVIAAPVTLWFANVGTAFPALDATPGAGWTKVGSSGSQNYDRGEGVTIEHRQTTVPWRSVGDTGTRKSFRTEEDLIIRLKLVDVTLEQYAIALNNNTVTDTPPGAGTIGTRKIGLSRGTSITTKALLIRSEASPYGADFVSQYEVPMAQQVGSPTVAQGKPGEPSGLNLEFMALVDTSAASADERFGRLIAQDAAAV